MLARRTRADADGVADAVGVAKVVDDLRCGQIACRGIRFAHTAVQIVAPAEHGSVIAQRAVMARSRGQRDDTGQVDRVLRLRATGYAWPRTQTVAFSPAFDSAIGLHQNAEVALTTAHNDWRISLG